MKALGLVVNLLQSLAALMIGLHLINIDLMAYLASSGSLIVLVKPIQAIFGLVGLYGLYNLFVCNECC